MTGAADPQMPPSNADDQGRWRASPGTTVVFVLIVTVVGGLIVPLTQWLLDLLIGANLALSILVLSMALFVRRPLSFTAFPTLLLVATLYRLALNVASTKLILREADAGRIIGAFGKILVGGDIIVGAVVFGILVMVLFLVITKGAERVAEVSARFTLDALPGMQLAIESDHRAGIVSAREVSRRRGDLETRSHYYGSLDGAMKFVRGDAIVGLVIVGVNIVGGLAIGISRRGMSVGEALDTYGRLTVGDGLVTMIPALLISTAAGLLVTRVGQSESEGRLGDQLLRQLSAEPRALLSTAGLLLLLAFVPGLPAWPFLLLCGLLGAGGIAVLRRSRRDAAADEEAARGARGPSGERMGLDEVQRLVDEVERRRPVLVRETVPARVGLAALADVLHLLVRDGLGPERLPEMLEAVARVPAGKGPEEIAERIRKALAPSLTGRLLDGDRVLAAAVLAQEVEAVLESGLTTTARGPRLALPAEVAEQVISACARALKPMERPVLLVSPALRRPLDDLLGPSLPGAVVLAQDEMDADARVEVVASVDI